MYKKLEPASQELADEAIKKLLELVNIEDTGSERAKELARDLRVKKITKFKKESPPRHEATFDYDGRIVWRLDHKSNEVVLVYIGGHNILNKK